MYEVFKPNQHDLLDYGKTSKLYEKVSGELKDSLKGEDLKGFKKGEAEDMPKRPRK